MEQKISEIKSILQAASIKELPAFISTYEEDRRSGVVSLVGKAKKQMADYEKELERTEKMKLYEKKYSDFSYICGIDEVGRGPLARDSLRPSFRPVLLFPRPPAAPALVVTWVFCMRANGQFPPPTGTLSVVWAM